MTRVRASRPPKASRAYVRTADDEFEIKNVQGLGVKRQAEQRVLWVPTLVLLVSTLFLEWRGD